MSNFLIIKLQTSSSIFFRIEHVFPDVLEEIPYVIFSQIHPKIICITTPNCEFNQLFDLPDGKFRHYDHKFEWSRQQFQDWAENICARYPEYSVIFAGIGKPPMDFEHLGTVSQMAVFLRKDFVMQTEEDVIQQEQETSLVDLDGELEDIAVEVKECPGYEVIHSVTYPFFKDKRSHEQKLIDEIAYAISNLRYYDAYFNDDADRIEIPVSHIVDSCYKVSEDFDEIRKVIESQKYCLDGDFVIMKSDDQEQSGSECEQQDD